MSVSASPSQWGADRFEYLAKAAFLAVEHKVVGGLLRRQCRNIFRRCGLYFEVPVDGLMIRCRLDNATERSLIAGDVRKRETVDLITRELKAGDAFVDIGANCGLYTLFAARRVGSAGRVVAIEPIPEMTRRLRANVAANGFSRVSVHETALGAEEGELTLYVRRDQYGESSVEFTGPQRRTLTRVPVTTLARVVASEGLVRIDALKIDVEGYEDRVLMPFFSDAERGLWPRRLLLEHSNSGRWRDDLLAVLTARGYRQIWRSEIDALFALE